MWKIFRYIEKNQGVLIGVFDEQNKYTKISTVEGEKKDPGEKRKTQLESWPHTWWPYTWWL